MIVKVLPEISSRAFANRDFAGSWGGRGTSQWRKEVMNLSSTRSEMAPKQVGPQD